eukprot:gnl/TRDRNA2_/TRDRNA2_106831_c0_seq1.p1 gnl/TRDRNA2_/TRDRNA2_106831_c0~~gnl/TRDRNA2_/TRDRNA2_106831_c0_seq1.p1  ORF type:complete len:265 (-),score=26.60 gnl/TRDRNA2_/TRDRNA2_106831_c0_seq1:303-1097(-)
MLYFYLCVLNTLMPLTHTKFEHDVAKHWEGYGSSPLYFHTKVTAHNLPALGLGLGIISSSFAVFLALLPKVWEKDSCDANRCHEISGTVIGHGVVYTAGADTGLQNASAGVCIGSLPSSGACGPHISRATSSAAVQIPECWGERPLKDEEKTACHAAALRQPGSKISPSLVQVHPIDEWNMPSECPSMPDSIDAAFRHSNSVNSIWLTDAMASPVKQAGWLLHTFVESNLPWFSATMMFQLHIVALMVELGETLQFVWSGQMKD